MRRARLLGLILSVGVAGCASDGLADRLAALKEFTVADATTALEIATKGQDKAAMQCYPFILTKLVALEALQPRPLVPGQLPGLLTEFETVRVAIHGPHALGEEFFADLDLHCAALRTSVEIDVAKGALLASSVAGSGGAAAPGVAIKVLPILLRLLRRRAS